MELEFKCSALKQLKIYKKKNPIAYKIIREKLGDIMKNPQDIRYGRVKNILNINKLEKETIESVLK